MNIAVVGAGNVAHHLIDVLSHSDHHKIWVYNRSKEKAQLLSEQFDIHHCEDLDQLLQEPLELIILAIPDDAIHNFSLQLVNTEILVVHTSGSEPMVRLETKNSGVFYPLQSFTIGVDIAWNKVPICLEASSTENLILLEQLANSISKSVYKVDSEQRKRLHLGAVIVNNFTNHLNFLAERFLKEHGLEFDILRPLIQETFRKIDHEDIYASQTGPARRNDKKILAEHLNLLKEHEMMQKIYNLVSQSIRNEYQK
ncbi:MAG: DUF2520 domain-containing protein [Flavobacteriales bacterium]|nr:DUF2520 domain-containing protein [Flavobacteriales bacterium]